MLYCSALFVSHARTKLDHWQWGWGPQRHSTCLPCALLDLGAPKDTPRASLPYAIPATAAVSLLQLLSTNLPEVSLGNHQAAS